MGEGVAAAASGFVHLHNHSHYSLLDGLQKVPQMLDRVKELGMGAVALTDHGTLSGAVEFYNEANRRKLKPIIGIETYVAPRSHTDKAGKQDANPYHLILLAENQTGYANLMKLASIAHLEGFYYKPRVDRALLEQHHEGLIALSACAGGEVATHIRNGALDQAQAVVEWYRGVFGVDNYFLELQDHEHVWEEQKRINDGLRELAKRTGAPMVVTADSHYCLPSDREAHEILLCVQTGKTVGDTDRMTMEMPLHLSDPAEVAARWQAEPEVLANTVRIAERCQWRLELGKILIPTFEVPTEETERDYLTRLTWQGLMWRYGNIVKEDVGLITPQKAQAELAPHLVERAKFELETIASMGYDGYFLIVADFINWGKNQGIIFGPGRGSAAGSIVSYALNITDLDPIKYELLFERFLNPDRISMPDIDIDIQDSRREEVIAYVTEKYGQERVAQIITFGTMAARNAVRDTGRAIGYPYGEVDAVAKMIPPPIQGRHIPLATSIKDDPTLRQEYNSNPRTKRLIDLAMRLEGTIRSNGVHAAGVVIAPEPIVNYTPLQRAQKGGIATQYSMGPIEDLGLLKMDFLGLSNLTIIKNTLRIIKKVDGQSIDISTIPLDDTKTYAMLGRGDTTGVFQFESSGMKRYLRDLKPTVFDDIVAMGALYRPGPLSAGLTDSYINRKNGREQVAYAHESMRAALSSTYGVLVYQEQVMRIAKDLCGFTGSQADSLRYAIGKKKAAAMAKMKAEFIAGAVKTSQVTEQFALDFWRQLEGFADYCFNKSHSACYGLISYQTAYLKAHFPAAFMAALMTSDRDNIERIAIEVAECQRMGIPVLPPSVNESFMEFGVVQNNGAIRFGLGAIKNVGLGAIEAILRAREVGGEFAGIEDFAKRVDAGEVNKKVWESLIKAGALDCFGERGQLLFNLDVVTAYGSKAQKNALSGQIDIFGSLGESDNLPALHLELPPSVPSNRDQLLWEKELLGLYLSHHPLDDYAGYLADHSQPIASLNELPDGTTVTVGGIVTRMHKIFTKSNDAMAFAAIEDKTAGLELVVFPKAFKQAPEIWVPDQVLVAVGKINRKDRDGKPGGEIKILVDKAAPVEYDTAASYVPKVKPVAKAEEPIALAPEPVEDTAIPNNIEIQLPSLTDTELLIQIKDLLAAHPGRETAYLVLPGSPGKRIRLPQTVAASAELLAALATLVGENAVGRVG